MPIIRRASETRTEANAVYVCVCKGVRLSEAVESAQRRGCSPDSLKETWGFDDSDACGRCLNNIERISDQVKLKLAELPVGTG